MLANSSGASFEGAPSEKGENEGGPKYPPMPTPYCQSGQGRGCRVVGELETLSEEKGTNAGPHHSVRDFATVGGQGGPIVHVVPAHPCRLLPDQPHESALFQARLTQTARTVTPRQGSPSRPPFKPPPGHPLRPRALVLIPVWTRHASRGRSRQNSHP